MDTNILILGGGLAAVTVGFIVQSIQLRSQRRQHLYEKAELERQLRNLRVQMSITDYDKRAALERAERAEAAATVHRLHTISASSQAPRPRYDRPATVYQASPPKRTSHARDDDHTEFGPVFSLHRDDDDSRSCGSCGDSCSSDSSSSDSGSSDSGSCSSSGD